MNLIIFGMKLGAVIAVAYLTFTFACGIVAGIVNSFKSKEKKDETKTK